MVRVSVAVPLAALIALAGCKTTNMTDGVESAGSAVADGARGVAASLVNVNLSNVLNDLALDLKIDKSSIPINAQIPINVAANVCGVSINILSIGAGGGSSRAAPRTASRLSWLSTSSSRSRRMDRSAAAPRPAGRARAQRERRRPRRTRRRRRNLSPTPRPRSSISEE